MTSDYFKKATLVYKVQEQNQLYKELVKGGVLQDQPLQTKPAGDHGEAILSEETTEE